MQRDWNSNVNQTKTASFPFINSKDERFHRPIIFKIVVRHLNVEEVQIPPQFLEYIKEVPFHTAILKGPSGCYWHVKICREAQGVFLRDGWKEFQRENSIMHHDLLIFRYIGNMFFDIEVFDENGLEKINTKSFAYNYEAAPSSKQRKGTPDKTTEAAAPSKERRDKPHKPLEAATSGVKRRGRPPKNNVDQNLCSAAQISYRSGLWATESERIANNCEAAPSMERMANNCEAAASTRKRNRSQIHLETTPSGAKRRGRPRKHLGASSFSKEKSGTELQRNDVGPLTFQASEGTDCRENLKASSHDEKRSDGTQNDDNVRVDMDQLKLYDNVQDRIESERIASYCEAAPSKERIANNCEAPASMSKLNGPQIDLETTPAGAQRSGRPHKHLEASSFRKDKSGTELQRDGVGPLTLQASEGTDCREHLKASVHDEKRRSDRTQNDDNVRVDVHQLKLYNYVPGRIESERIASNCEAAASKERIANNCEAPVPMRKINGPQIHLEKTPSDAQRSGRPHENLEASSFCKDKSGTELQRDDVGPLTLQASEGTDCREHLKASSHDEKRRSEGTQNDDSVSVDSHHLKRYNYDPGRIESERIACNCEAAASKERIANIWEAAASMVKINRPQIHLETTPSGRKRRGRPRKHLEASSFGKDKSGTELQKDNVGPLTLRASEGTDCREHVKASSHDEKRRSDSTQNDDNVRVGMHQLKLYDYVPDETGGMLPSRSSNDQDVTNKERTSGCRMRLEQCSLEGMLGTGERDPDGSDKKQHTQGKKKQNEANKRGSLPTMQTPSEKDIERAWRKSELLVLKSPYYKCYLENFHVQKYILPMSKPFAQKYFPGIKTAVVLRNSKGQDWTVNVVPTRTGHSFAGGWRSFALANKLNEGDVCVFELVERDVIQVHVFPCTGEVDSESSGSG